MSVNLYVICHFATVRELYKVLGLASLSDETKVSNALEHKFEIFDFKGILILSYHCLKFSFGISDAMKSRNCALQIDHVKNF